jgi:hypothetical protein
MTMLRTAIEQFLDHACAQQTRVDLRTKSGFMFDHVTITDVQDGACELKQVENHTARLYVLVIDQIEWAVRSRVQR